MGLRRVTYEMIDSKSDVCLYCRNVGLFCGDMRLFCGDMRLFCDVKDANLVHACVMTHAYLCHDAFTCVTGDKRRAHWRTW